MRGTRGPTVLSVASASGNGDDKRGAKWKSRLIWERDLQGPVRNIELCRGVSCVGIRE
jgi:hypothetical protein